MQAGGSQLIARDLVGGALILLVAGLLVGAWWSMRTNRPMRCLGMIVAIAFFVRAFAACDTHLHDWDERYHALVAKSLYQHPFTPMLYEVPLLDYDYREWISNHIWVHKEPLSLWLMTTSIALLGAHEFAVRLPSVLAMSIMVGCTFLMARRLAGDRAGFAAGVLVALHGELIELASGRTATDHPDALFISLIGIGGYLAVRLRDDYSWRAAVTIGAVAGLAGLAKSPVGFLVILLWFVQADISQYRTQWRSWFVAATVAGVTTLAVYLPWNVYTSWAFPLESAWEKQYTIRHMNEVLEGHDAPLFYFFHQIPVVYGPAAVAMLLWFAYRCVRDRLSPTHRLLALWFAVPYTLFTIAVTKMDAYPLIAAPAVVTIIAMGFDRLCQIIGEPVRWRQAAATVCVAAMLIVPLNLAYGSVRPLGNKGWGQPWAESMRSLGPAFATQKSVVFNVKRYIELMFYTTAIAYPHIPSEEQLQSVTQQGYRVFVIDSPDVPASLRDRAEITILPAETIAAEQY
jgi:4-amino-4-deoxy-L-arabinose transferase-like glycosyltransferase